MKKLGKRHGKRLAVLLSAAALAATVQVAASPAADASVVCNWGGGNYDSGSGVIKPGTYGLETGPYSTCGTVRKISGGELLYFHCWYENSYGNLWVYARVAGTQTMGWTSIDNFQSYYSPFERC